MKISDRIAEFIQAKGMSIRALEQTIGCSNGLLGRCINKKTEISSQWISKIIEAFPDVSSEWFMTGKGAMFKDNSDEFRINPTLPSQQNNRTGIPLIPFDAMAGYLSGEMSINEDECERLYMPGLKADFVIKISGNSMEPRYYDGDYVACEKASLGDMFFEWDKAYVVDTERGVLIKRVNPGATDSEILLESDNKKYRPVSMPIKSIYHIALVKGVVRIE